VALPEAEAGVPAEIEEEAVACGREVVQEALATATFRPGGFLIHVLRCCALKVIIRSGRVHLSASLYRVVKQF
jgi:hypothetical protein